MFLLYFLLGILFWQFSCLIFYFFTKGNSEKSSVFSFFIPGYLLLGFGSLIKRIRKRKTIKEKEASASV